MMQILMALELFLIAGKHQVMEVVGAKLVVTRLTLLQVLMMENQLGH